MNNKLRTVKPYGRIYTMGQEYFLLIPHSIVGDNWERDNCYRFLVVPTKPIAIEQNGYKTSVVYGYARHIVTNCFTIEYKYDIEDIAIPILDEIDVSLQEEENVTKNEVEGF